MKGNKIVVIIMVLLMITSVFSGCGKTETEAVNTSKVLFMAYQSEPVLDWDPSSGTSNEIIVYHNVYETLTRYNAETEEIDPLIAESFESSEDGMTWIFNIRDGLTFHDGSAVNAEAVKFSIDRTLELNLGAAYIWDSVESIEVVDDLTVQFNLTYAAPLSYIASSGYAAFIMSPKSINENPDNWLSDGHDAGSGPYKVKSTKLGEEVVLDKFDAYWKGWNDNQYDTIVIQKIAESSSRRQLIENGDVSVTMDLPSEDIEALKESDSVNIIEAKSFKNLMFMFNTEKGPLKDKVVRQALSYAFPYDDVINYAAGGYGVQSHGTIPKGIYGYDEDIMQYNYNLDQAKSLLAQAGYVDGGITLSLHYLSGDQLQKKTAELYKAELKKIGVELDIRSMPWDSYYEVALSPDPNDRQDIFAIFWWPDNALPSSWFQQLYHSEEIISWNMAYFNNPEFDQIVELADQKLFGDQAEAEKLFRQANEIVVDEALSIFALDSVGLYVTNKDIKGVKLNPAYDTVVFFYDCYK
jgi:peptide/nickel transport system substrate-binding protein